MANDDIKIPDEFIFDLSEEEQEKKEKDYNEKSKKAFEELKKREELIKNNTL